MLFVKQGALVAVINRSAANRPVEFSSRLHMPPQLEAQSIPVKLVLFQSHERSLAKFSQHFEVQQKFCSNHQRSSFVFFKHKGDNLMAQLIKLFSRLLPGVLGTAVALSLMACAPTVVAHDQDHAQLNLIPQPRISAIFEKYGTLPTQDLRLLLAGSTINWRDVRTGRVTAVESSFQDGTVVVNHKTQGLDSGQWSVDQNRVCYDYHQAGRHCWRALISDGSLKWVNNVTGAPEYVSYSYDVAHFGPFR